MAGAQWCGNQLPHPEHDICHGVREPDPDVTVDFAHAGPDNTITVPVDLERLDGILAHRGGLTPDMTLTAGDEHGTKHPATVVTFGSDPRGEWITLRLRPDDRLPGIPATPTPPRPGRAVIPLPEIDLERLLGLPRRMRIVAIGHDFQRLAILLGVESPDLPRRDPAAVAPELGGRFSVETKTDADGKLWYRWHWAEETEQLAEDAES